MNLEEKVDGILDRFRNPFMVSFLISFLIYNYELVIIYFTYNNETLVKYYNCDFLEYTNRYFNQFKKESCDWYNPICIFNRYRYFTYPFIYSIISLILIPTSKQCSLYLYKWIKKNILHNEINNLQIDTPNRIDYLRIQDQITIFNQKFELLEIFKNDNNPTIVNEFTLSFNKENGTVIWIVDETKTYEFRVHNFRREIINSKEVISFNLKKDNSNNELEYYFYISNSSIFEGNYLYFENNIFSHRKDFILKRYFILTNQ